MYRAIILARLEERDRRTTQFVRLISALNVQSGLLNFILNDRLSNRPRKRTLSECASNVEIETLSHELANVYKSKSINDQSLIDVQAEITRKEMEIASSTNQKELMKRRLLLATGHLTSKDAQILDLRRSKAELQDELIQVEATYEQLKRRLDQTQEQIEEMLRQEESLIETVKTVKQSRIDLLNEHNDHEFEKLQDRLCAELADAMANLQH